MVVRGKGHKARFSLSISTYYPIAEAGGVDEGTFLPTCFLGAQRRDMGDWDDGHREQAGSRIT
jgi:hypothetical protein